MNSSNWDLNSRNGVDPSKGIDTFGRALANFVTIVEMEWTRVRVLTLFFFPFEHNRGICRNGVDPSKGIDTHSYDEAS